LSAGFTNSVADTNTAGNIATGLLDEMNRAAAAAVAN
jgi:hypothetical protein